MGGNRVAPIIVAVLVVASMQLAIAQVTYKVGGSTGWTKPSNPSFYSDWLSTSAFEFHVGDTIFFEFSSSHDVAEVSAAAYQSCDGSKPITISSVSKVSVTFDTTGTRYFICTSGGGSHCKSGQKIAISVTSSSSSPTTPPSDGTSTPSSSPTTPPSDGTSTPSPPPPPPPSPTPPPPPPSSASYPTAAAACLMFGLVYVLGFFI